MLVVLPHDNDFENEIDVADGAKVKARDQAIADVVNGQIQNDNIANDAAIDGVKLSTTSPVPTDRIADDAVTDAKLRDDAATDANRAVTTNHIRDAAVTAAKLGALALILAKVKTANFDWAPGGSLAGGAANSITTAITTAAGLPIAVQVQRAGAPTNPTLAVDAGTVSLQLTLHLNTSTNTYYLVVYNTSGLPCALAGVTFRMVYIPAS
jgi:hypothetical protein